MFKMKQVFSILILVSFSITSFAFFSGCKEKRAELNKKLKRLKRKYKRKRKANSYKRTKRTRIGSLKIRRRTRRKVAVLSGSRKTETGVLKIISWNLLNLGRSKTPEAIKTIANILRDADIVAIQEVTIRKFGAQAVAKIDDALDRTGSKWDYKISKITSGKHGRERYAFLWKSHKVSLKSSTLAKVVEAPIDREPFLGRFQINGTSKTFLLASFHAVPKQKKPQREVILLPAIAKKYSRSNILFMGDFNLSQKHKAFSPLKAMGYVPAFTGLKTSLRMRRRKKNDHLANEYDNIFFKGSRIKIIKGGVIDFSRKFKILRKARKVSDHLPVYIHIDLRKTR